MEEMHFVELWFVEMIHVLGAPKTITHVEKGWPTPPLKFQKRKISPITGLLQVLVIRLIT